ncbi:chemotaxis protein CheA [Accumulibacter sp.]|uniref:chemotaxis protein CheA n=1 Tax=Accumulibacter sp. TaxID=2053492 RepID=UPI0025E9D179|nr:chemotaxis protein CheA [Accumulibacter sp.]MCM8613529.1 chemotaxis protein CheA [Accumulibacter sp.]MCM8637156.1 chemotaxis protein CheA [Accumulibacter sp.]MCM8640780.1 chemotaxis protein CheA [Accumulibacter sp.]
MDELTSTFVNESRDQLTAMEDGLLRLEQNPGDTDNLNAIFRAAHTIKGGSGVVESTFIEAFTHRVENVLDKLRNGEIPVSGELSTVMLECCDHIGALLAVLAAGLPQPAAELQARGDALLARLSEQFLDGRQAAGGAPGAELPVEHGSDLEASGGVVVHTDAWHISIRFGTGVLRNGMDPLSFLQYLSSLGEIIAITTLADGMPAAAEMDPECCYLGFEIRFQTRASKAQIEQVFEFVRDDCALRILPPHSKISEYIELINALPEDPMRLGEILIRSGALTTAELEEGLALQTGTHTVTADGAAARPLPIGDILVDQKVVHRELVDAAASRQTVIAEKKAVEARMVRVHADKLDQLIDLVGEMVIAGAGANLLAQRSGQSDLMESTSILLRLVEDIRDSALQLRMVQIGETFNRFNRVIRDSSRELGKSIDLVITGAETELDKSVVEKLGDPLMHLVRNAIDHGIEGAALRAERGKPENGTVQLNAYHDSGSVVIEVSDDGGGLPRDKIRNKAIDKGLLDASATPSDQEITNLIFEAGFSTADQVTNISGRGVGMDVVRRNIQSLRGSIEVASIEGEGSTFTIRLPLTLAIIDGFLTGVGKASYVVPLDSVVECIELADVPGERNYLNLRGEVLPFVRLRELFDIGGEAPARQNVVIVQYAGHKAGLVVDALLGEFQTVIKPLGALFKHLRGIGGSTILGTGDVALIVDVAALVERASARESQRLSQRLPAAIA